MKFLAALAFLATALANPFVQSKDAAAKAKYVRSLTSAAVPTKNSQLRRLNEEYEVNIARYSVKFEQCQFVKTYDDELANDEDTPTVLATKRFVLFRLCPDSDCASCNYNYGEYLVDLETYLQVTTEYFQDYQEEMCKICEENCYNNANQYNNANNQQQQDNGEEQQQEEQQDEGERKLQQYYNVDCSTCWEECQKIENMEENGYIDATEFLECQMIYDPEDDNSQGLYAGPVCASGGTKIKIGVFTDEDCLFLDQSKDVDDYLMDGDGVYMKLSHALLKSTYTDTCISCMEPQEQDQNNNGNDAEDADEVIDMCEQLYDEAAKCEKTHGFDDGYANYYGYENQLAQEEVVCDFMQSLKSGTYDEEGEIIVSGASTTGRGGKSTTGGQKFALTFFILGTVGLAVYAAMLHSKLTKGAKTDLASSGGAMA
jgi:hypothetical protein